MNWGWVCGGGWSEVLGCSVWGFLVFFMGGFWFCFLGGLGVWFLVEVGMVGVFWVFMCSCWGLCSLGFVVVLVIQILVVGMFIVCVWFFL